MTTMVITFEQNAAQMVIRFKSEEGPTSTPAEAAAVEETTSAIAAHLAAKCGDATIVRRDPAKESVERWLCKKCGQRWLVPGLHPDCDGEEFEEVP